MKKLTWIVMLLCVTSFMAVGCSEEKKTTPTTPDPAAGDAGDTGSDDATE